MLLKLRALFRLISSFSMCFCKVILLLLMYFQIGFVVLFYAFKVCFLQLFFALILHLALCAEECGTSMFNSPLVSWAHPRSAWCLLLFVFSDMINFECGKRRWKDFPKVAYVIKAFLLSVGLYVSLIYNDTMMDTHSVTVLNRYLNNRNLHSQFQFHSLNNNEIGEILFHLF